MTRNDASFGQAAIVSTTPILVNEPVAVALLDLIGSVEAPGGYNQRYAEPSSGPFKYDLINMSINDVIDLPANKPRGKVASTASGRYQFLSTTLRSVKDKLNLTGDEHFDPPMQDRLAYQLLINRGYERWKQGEITDIAFGKNIAQEWASFPVLADTVRNGKTIKAGGSYYGGDGTNKALVSTDQVYRALRAMSATKEPPPMPPPPDIEPPTPRPEPRTLWEIVVAFLAWIAGK